MTNAYLLGVLVAIKNKLVHFNETKDTPTPRYSSFITLKTHCKPPVPGARRSPFC